MNTVNDLIEKQRALNAPPPPAPSKLQKLIAKQREWVDNRWETVPVVLASEVVEVALGRISGQVWCRLESIHPPRAQADIELRYDRLGLPRDYPAERIKLNGDLTTEETWRDLYDLLGPDDRTNVAAVMWGINVGEPSELLERLKRKRVESKKR